MRLAAELGGTISAEHGVGVTKARHLGLVRSREELYLLQHLKEAVDPAFLMNPGVILPRADVLRHPARRPRPRRTTIRVAAASLRLSPDLLPCPTWAQCEPTDADDHPG